jgi:hypothetical protein
MAFNDDTVRVPYYGSGSIDQKPPFRATGRGFAVDVPDHFKAGQFNSNASLAADVRGSSSPEKIYLFVNRVSTGWSLSGEHGQTRQSRAFYPRNLSQGDFLIEGIAASQTEFDRLVEFVLGHHMRIVGPDHDQVESANQTRSARFMMGTPGAYADSKQGPEVGRFYSTDTGTRRFASPGHPRTYRHAPPIYWDVAITGMAAGHERFKFFPTFQLTCKVLNDHLQSDSDVEFSIMNAVDYAQIFREFGHPLPEGVVPFSGDLDKSTQQRLQYSGTGGVGGAGTGAAGGLGNWAPGGDASPYASQIAAQAPPLDNPTAGNPIKATFTGCIPPDPGREYFGEFKDEKRVFGVGRDQSGNNEPNCAQLAPHIHVKYRNPPGGGDTRTVYV